MSDEAEEPKLIVDEDWKTKVQREKEELEKQKAAAASEGEAGTAETPSETQQEIVEEASQDERESAPPQLPPASLQMLVTSLGTQAMASMGLVPGEDGKPMPAQLDFAKHFIDLIAVLEEKTKGNVTPDENSYLQDTLYQLRMAFVEVNKAK